MWWESITKRSSRWLVGFVFLYCFYIVFILSNVYILSSSPLLVFHYMYTLCWPQWGLNLYLSEGCYIYNCILQSTTPTALRIAVCLKFRMIPEFARWFPEFDRKITKLSNIHPKKIRGYIDESVVKMTFEVKIIQIIHKRQCIPIKNQNLNSHLIKPQQFP